MSIDDTILKKKVALAALAYIEPGITIGVGSGSTVNLFIEQLSTIKAKVKETVSSSVETTQRLLAHGFAVKELSEVNKIDIYIDGADEFDSNKNLIKGGGGKLTREKIIASASQRFICIVDATKKVNRLGKFPLPIEVIPMARSEIAKSLIKQYQAEPVYRQNLITDNGNQILDVYNLVIENPVAMEIELNNIAGVVTNGLFTQNRPDIILISQNNGKISSI